VATIDLQIAGAGRKAALAITGGGSGAVGELLRVPGGSRLLIEAQVMRLDLILSRKRVFNLL
jgi:hypothetical protein